MRRLSFWNVWRRQNAINTHQQRTEWCQQKHRNAECSTSPTADWSTQRERAEGGHRVEENQRCRGQKSWTRVKRRRTGRRIIIFVCFLIASTWPTYSNRICLLSRRGSCCVWVWQAAKPSKQTWPSQQWATTTTMTSRAIDVQCNCAMQLGASNCNYNPQPGRWSIALIQKLQWMTED